MARVLVTRAEPEAEHTAALVAQAGHEPLLVPLAAIQATGAPFPDIVPGAVLATSRRALSVAPSLPAALLARPIHCVGERTAEAAARAGFHAIHIAGGDAESLVDRIIRDVRPDTTLLYLAGEPRRPETEARLRGHGFALVTMIRYRMQPAAILPARLAEALRQGGIDCVLHFSPESARTFMRLAMQAGLSSAAMRIDHLCLSEGIAAALRDEGGAALPIHVASRPLMQDLLSIIPSSRSSNLGLT